MAKLELDKIVKIFDTTRVVDQLSLTINDGEFVSLLGPSGCGKTTTLSMIAGFLQPDGGEIRIGGQNVTDLPPYRRNTGMVFQNYALFPHMTVAQNIGFGLKMRKVAAAEIAPRVKKTLDLVRLPNTGDRYPRQLSGGQQQRIAIARALVIEPEILLLDEPLSNLDAKLREEMRIELREIQRRVEITTVFVTHDQAEALAMSDRVAVMHRGIIVQVGAPVAIYDRPANEFVADFIGTTNVVEGEFIASDGPYAKMRLAGGLNLQGVSSSGSPGSGPAKALVRPEKITLSADASPSRNTLPGRVAHSVFLGMLIHYVIETEAGRFSVICQNLGGSVHTPGMNVALSWEFDSTLILAAEVSL
jgi:putative spermidine/putrescine transport system ATP-binding protein